jgi:AbrB family looped-hinge helix DNA binding protein
MSEQTFFKSRLRKKGQITIPNPVREVLNAEEGDDLVFAVNESGQVIVERVQIIPPDQAWFWTERWQQLEREAQADIVAGRVQQFEDPDEMIAWLDDEDDAED